MANSAGHDIVVALKQQVERYEGKLNIADVGTVVQIGDGIARIQGLRSARYNELLLLPGNVM
jgi:F-type H+-transporting ATPase subunit alpha